MGPQHYFMRKNRELMPPVAQILYFLFIFLLYLIMTYTLNKLDLDAVYFTMVTLVPSARLVVASLTTWSPGFKPSTISI